VNQFQGQAQGSTNRAISSAKRIVTKMGTSALATDGKLDEKRVGQLSRDISGLLDEGRQVVHVTSGAILAAMSERNIDRGTYRERFVSDDDYTFSLRLLSGEGQPRLMESYRHAFGRCGRRVAQLLVTRNDIENYSTVMKGLLLDDVIPILNENDALSYDEISFSDNDILAAMTCNAIGADLLVMLSDSEMYDSDPRKNRDAKHLEAMPVYKITQEMLDGANGTGEWGKGGLHSKLIAARDVGRFGRPTVLINYKDCAYDDMRIQRALRGDYTGTIFIP